MNITVTYNSWTVAGTVACAPGQTDLGYRIGLNRVFWTKAMFESFDAAMEAVNRFKALGYDGAFNIIVDGKSNPVG